MKIAVCIQLFYPDMFETIIGYLNNLKHQFKLYVTLTEGFYSKSDVENIKKYKEDVKLLFVKNKGVDIGAFLQTLKEIDNDTDLILKIHTKKGIGLPSNPSTRVQKYGLESSIEHGKNWFESLINGVLSDEGKVNRILEKFRTDSSCGMVGHRLYNNSILNKNEILKLSHLFGINETYLDKPFIGGTMFWVRYDIMKKYFNEKIIGEIMNITQNGYVIEPSPMHAIERIFGYLVIKEKQSIIVVK